MAYRLADCQIGVTRQPMSVDTLKTPTGPKDAFRHEALLYRGDSEFLRATVPFIRDGVTDDEPVLVVVSARKIELLREALGADADAVQFADMNEVGCNPARIIPAWQRFLDENVPSGRPIRGIGEPITADRPEIQLPECHRHESLLNVAFDHTTPFWLLCPYDRETLDPDVVEFACHTHPYLLEDDLSTTSDDYWHVDAAAPFAAPLPPPSVHPRSLPFTSTTLREVRAFVTRHAYRANIDDERAADLLLAVNEIATNSIRHGGGDGTLRVWEECDVLICEVSDNGFIADPLAGRKLPDYESPSGRGLWLANQLCDLVQIYSAPENGTVIRLHLRLG